MNAPRGTRRAGRKLSPAPGPLADPSSGQHSGDGTVKARPPQRKRPRRLVLVIPSLECGGAERQVSLLAGRLAPFGLDVEVVTFQPGGVFRAVLEQASVPVHTFSRDGWLGLASLYQLFRFLRQRPPDILHAFLWSANFRARLVGLILPRTHLVISLRGFDDDLRWFHRFADGLVNRRTDLVVSNCRALMEEASRKGTARHARHVVIHNGIPVASAACLPLQAPHRPFTVGYVGRLERKKNPLALVALAARLVERTEEIRFLVVGSGRLALDLEAAIQRAGLTSYFKLLGSQRQVESLYGRMDVLVNTSLSEGCCNVLLEAMRAGLPVVATAVGGNREIVAEGETGFLVPQGRVEEMAQAVERLSRDKSLARRMGRAARRRLLERFSLTAMVKAYGDLYAELLEDRSEPEGQA